MTDPWAEVAETIDEFRTEDMDTEDIVRWLRDRFDLTPKAAPHHRLPTGLYRMRAGVDILAGQDVHVLSEDGLPVAYPLPEDPRVLGVAVTDAGAGQAVTVNRQFRPVVRWRGGSG